MVTPEPLHIAYFGTPEFAVPALEALFRSSHPVVAVVSQPDRPRGRGQRLTATPTKEVGLRHGVPVLQPAKLRDEGFLGALRALAPDLGVVAAYGRILPESLLELPRLGMINVHASLLPAYRGAAPVHRAVIAGETETGVSIMRVVEELDAGPVFATAARPIGPEETSVDVERALAALGASLLVDVVDHMAAGRTVEVPQDHERATYAPKIAREESRIDWSLPPSAVHNLVRGLQPWPLVSIWMDGVRHQLRRSRISPDRTSSAPGTIVQASAGRFGIATGENGVIDVLMIQPEGKRIMTAREFLAGRSVPTGLSIAAP
jgi:methionyl-tRNA formyltransferase